VKELAVKKKCAVLILFLVVLAGYAPAQANDEARKAAAELVKVVMPKAQYESMIQMISTQMGSKLLQDMRQKGMNPPDDFAQRMSRTMLEIMPYDEQLALATDAYADNFTLDEIHTMAAFYKTPVGEKVLSLQPKITGETMQKLMAKVTDRLPAAMEHNGLLPPENKKSAPVHHQPSKPKTAPTT
jgi:hypothetical protein